MEWNKTEDGFPIHEEPVLVSTGKYIYAACAVWIDCGEDGNGWLWHVLDYGHACLNFADNFVLDDDYSFEYWMDMPEAPEVPDEH